MFARKVAARLKPDSLTQFVSIIEQEIVPWLRQRRGFVDLIVLAIRGSDEIATISFWEQESDADAWAANGFPEATRTLEKILDGPSYVKTFDVVSSTVHEFSQLHKFGSNALDESAMNSSSPAREISQ